MIPKKSLVCMVLGYDWQAQESGIVSFWGLKARAMPLRDIAGVRFDSVFPCSFGY